VHPGPADAGAAVVAPHAETGRIATEELTVEVDLSEKPASARSAIVSAQFRSTEVVALEKRQRCFKNPYLTTIEFEFLSTLRRGADLP